MSITIAAHYDGHALVPDRPLNLSAGQRVTVEVEEVSMVDDSPDRLWNELKLDTELSRQIVYSGGLLSVRGTRITVKLIQQLADDGLSAAEIHDRLPTANLATIERLLEFSQCTPKVVRDYLDAQQADDSNAFDAEHRGPTLEHLRARLHVAPLTNVTAVP